MRVHAITTFRVWAHHQRDTTQTLQRRTPNFRSRLCGDKVAIYLRRRRCVALDKRPVKVQGMEPVK